MDLKSLSMDAYFFLGHQKPDLLGPQSEYKVHPVLRSTIESVYIKDITKDTLSLFWSWLEAVTLSKSQGELPNLRKITYSFVERLKNIYHSALVKAHIFLTCPRDIVSAIGSAGIELLFIRISKAVQVIEDGAFHQELKYLRLDDERGNQDKDKEEEDGKEAVSILDLIDEKSDLNNPDDSESEDSGSGQSSSGDDSDATKGGT